ncbi:MAG TPA: hypothetical protein VLE23_08730 [Geminicoccaceae bacterium]|nr:hypothetical protein [Geminicoccaceae bacterium]
MRSRTALAAVVTAGLGACGGPRAPELDYLPPSAAPARERSALVEQQPWLVLGNVLDHLQQRGLPVVEVDEAAGELVVAYSGDPEPYVDCGWIVTWRKDELDRLPAASADASFARRWNNHVVTVDRDLRLDARMTVRIEPAGEDTVVHTASTYVLTKTATPQTAEQPLHAETISFPTGASAAFSSGTTCQPNGALERLVLDALPDLSFVGS